MILKARKQRIANHLANSIIIFLSICLQAGLFQPSGFKLTLPGAGFAHIMMNEF